MPFCEICVEIGAMQYSIVVEVLRKKLKKRILEFVKLEFVKIHEVFLNFNSCYSELWCFILGLLGFVFEQRELWQSEWREAPLEDQVIGGRQRGKDWNATPSPNQNQIHSHVLSTVAPAGFSYNNL